MTIFEQVFALKRYHLIVTVPPLHGNPIAFAAFWLHVLGFLPSLCGPLTASEFG